MIINGKEILTINVPVIAGCCAELVSSRRLVNKYETNRAIKTWAHYFLLKALTSSGIIKTWTKQKAELLEFTKMNENSFRTRLTEMKNLGLCTITKHTKTITLTSYEKAADILGIEYTGKNNIPYKTDTNENQIFRYQLMGEEIRQNQQDQQTELMRKVNKNPLLKSQLIILMQQEFSVTEKQLRQTSFFQQKLLQLQIETFKHGSALYEITHSLRADINRSVKGMQKAQGAKSASTISYMKKVMAKYGLLKIEKKTIDSDADVRSRKTLPGGRDGYKWFKAKKTTAWVLCDQLSFTYATQVQPPKIQPKQNEKNETRKAA